MLDELQKIREEKLEKIQAFGMDPFPSKVPRDFSVADITESFTEKKDAGVPVSIAGRVMAIRGQGAIMFVVLDDGTGKFQAVFKKDEIEESLFSLFTDTVDMGDVISVTGTLFTTERGQDSILVTAWTMATKSLLPLPDKWNGIADEDERFRKRYLDMLMNPELRELLLKKGIFWDTTRRFMKEHGLDRKSVV